MREAFLDCARDLKTLYEEGQQGSAEEEELWNLLVVYLQMMDDDEKAKILVETIIMWKGTD